MPSKGTPDVLNVLPISQTVRRSTVVMNPPFNPDWGAPSPLPSSQSLREQTRTADGYVYAAPLVIPRYESADRIEEDIQTKTSQFRVRRLVSGTARVLCIQT